MQPDMPMAKLSARINASARLYTGVHLPYGVLPVYSSVFRDSRGMLADIGMADTGIAGSGAPCHPSCVMSYNFVPAMGGD